MTDFKRIFLDTAPLIYYLQNDNRYNAIIEQIFYDFRKSGAKFILSDITIAEYLVYPFKNNDIVSINNFNNFLSFSVFEICHTTLETAYTSAKIRAEAKGFKTMDAFQLATALYNQADLFLTNDKQLKQFKDLRCATIDDFS